MWTFIFSSLAYCSQLHALSKMVFMYTTLLDGMYNFTKGII